ncbi:hypothetical protein ACNKHU_05675 [Shigella flexneri]
MENASMSISSHFRRWQPVRYAGRDRQRRLDNPETEQYTCTISQRTPATPDQAEKTAAAYSVCHRTV